MTPAVSGYTIEKIFFFGNRFNRQCDQNDIHTNVNVFLRGGPFTIDDVESSHAVCGSGMIVDASTHHFTIKNSWFAYNGFPEGFPGHEQLEWSDGLTVHRCVNGYVADNHFVDNTDVDLIFGGYGPCIVDHNQISHVQQYGFAGLMLAWFDPSDPEPNYSGFKFERNQITSGLDALAVGMMVGAHPWGPSIINNQLQLPWISDAGQVGNASLPNTIQGSVINLAIDGIRGGSVIGNVTTGSQRQVKGLFGCSVTSNYTAGHYWPAIIQDEATAFSLGSVRQ